MALPVNIEKLIHGNTVEWERLEFKKSWNPVDVMHTMCAFANDIHNWGGGYIIIGITETDGEPNLPPVGLQRNQLDAFQKKAIELGHKIQPNYFPVIQPYVIQGQHIMVLWCPAGDNRIYTTPESLAKNQHRLPYVRIGSESIVARGENLRRLQELTARIPFDDRTNNRSTLQDLDLGLIQSYLQEINSNLLSESISMPFKDLCKTMHIAKGPDEDLRPVNVGLLFFSKEPDDFFPRAWIELVWHQDNTGKRFKEHYFKGPLHKQIRDTLSFLQTNILSEQVVKHSGRAEAERFYNFPYDAVEEVISNAVYHKSYELSSPIEIQVWPDKIEVLSHPGPMPPVNAAELSTQKRIIARVYRNRRIGDFLKELRLTEARGTGFPTIYGAMASNGSPDPVFKTDDKTYVLVTLPVHEQYSKSIQLGVNVSNLIFKDLESIVVFTHQVGNQVSNQGNNQDSNQGSNQVSNQVSNQGNNQDSCYANDQVKSILNDQVHSRVQEVLIATKKWIKRADLLSELNLSNQSKNRKKYLDPLIHHGWIEMEYPNKRTSPNQRYRVTLSGEKLLNLIKQG